MQLEVIDKGVFRIWQKVANLKYVTPINQKEEKEKFFLSPKNNPQFAYSKLDFDPVTFKKRLANYKKRLNAIEQERNIAVLLSKKIDKLVQWITLLKSIGTERFTRASLAHYGRPTSILVSRAREILENTNPKQPRLTVSSKEVVSYLRKQTRLLDLKWNVKEIVNLSARADNVAPEKTLYIKKGEWFSRNDLKKLTVHELGVHATRAQNALKQKYKIFYMGTAEYEAIEEGLAVIMEEKHGVLDQNALRSYAGRVIAINWSLEKSFRDTYNKLLIYFSPAEAYSLTLRAKRGLRNTSNAGAFTKDYIYLEGRELLKKVKNLDPLYIGRISIDDLPHLHKH